jgi:hypothetical protein
MVNRTENNNEPKEMEITGKNFENVESFKYLGLLVTDLNEMEIENKSGLAAGNGSYHALGPMLKQRSMSQSIKIRIYKTVIRPILIYVAQACALTNKMEKMLMTWERKILRNNYGATCENGHWRIKIISELESKYKSQDIFSVIKVRRLEWLGHIVRMNETRTVKKIFEEKLGGRRGRGRPRLRWIDDVEDDLRNIGIKRWRIKVLDRVELTSIIKEAKVKLKGP